jgi:hypothetical protein
MTEDIEVVLMNLSWDKKFELSVALAQRALDEKNSLEARQRQEPQQNISMVNSNPSSLVPSQVRGYNLSNIQRKVLLQLAKGLPDEDNWNSLYLGRSQYFNILSQLRILFNVKKNRDLTLLAMSLDNPK